MQLYSQPDRPWCPECGSSKYSWEREDGRCDRCGTELVDEWPLHAKAWDAASLAFALSLVVLLFLGPPVYILWRIITGVSRGAPLYQVEMVRTVTTQPEFSGILPDVGLVFVVWLVLLLVGWCAAGGCPRRF